MHVLKWFLTWHCPLSKSLMLWWEWNYHIRTRKDSVKRWRRLIFTKNKLRSELLYRNNILVVQRSTSTTNTELCDYRIFEKYAERIITNWLDSYKVSNVYTAETKVKLVTEASKKVGGLKKRDGLIGWNGSKFQLSIFQHFWDNPYLGITENIFLTVFWKKSRRGRSSMFFLDRGHILF